MDQAFAEIFSPMQMGIVLVLALLLFGPKKLPELGKQLGSALRDLNKAKNDMMKSFSLDHDPDDHNHNRHMDYDSHHYDHAGYQDPYRTASPDLTDYTMFGVPPADTKTQLAITSGVPYETGPGASSDYVIISPKQASSEPDPVPRAGDHPGSDTVV